MATADSPTFVSLFSGIGGIDLGLERAGWQCRLQVEWDPFCQRVLAKHWPDVPRLGDITTVDWSTVERVDLVAGGFPCQPVSSAGKQRAQADARWLWPEFERAVRELRPRFVLVENVRNLIRVNDGSAFAEVLGGLAALGYDTQWRCIGAADVGAPHRRDRLWIVADAAGVAGRVHAGWPDGSAAAIARGSSARDVADPAGGGRGARQRDDDARQPDAPRGSAQLADAEGEPVGARLRAGEQGRLRGRRPGDVRGADDQLADAAGQRVEGHRAAGVEVPRAPAGEALPGRDSAGRGAGDGPAQSGVGGGADGLPGGLDGHRWPAPPGPQYAWEPPRVATGIVNRRPRLQGLGNAVVPQIVTLIGLEILERAGR